ncbi:hypothetical protein JRQ81_017606, partial [Phrynocephalus forsythii]
SGYTVEFDHLPPLGQIIIKPPSETLREEVNILLHKDAIEKVLADDICKFYSWYFTVPEKEGGLQPILDLRDINFYIHPK